MIAIGISSLTASHLHNWRPEFSRAGSPVRRRRATNLSVVNQITEDKKKPEICTADQLHYVAVSGSDWKLALWRYLPSPKAERRNHPLLLLAGLGVNAISYDLSPQSSFARYMSSKGFDTWTVEIRGAGLSSLVMDNYRKDDETTRLQGRRMEMVSKSRNSVSKFAETFLNLSERLSGYFEQGNNSYVASEIRKLRQKLLTDIEEGQQPFTSQIFQEPHLTTLNNFLEELDLIMKSDWDFDHYLEEDLPAAMDYIKSQTKPKDGKLLAIGHSLGGILLYAMLSRSCFEGRDTGLTSVTTLGSSLDYTSSQALFKLLLPVADPAKALNIPAIPLGALAAVIYPLATRPPYILSWFGHQISAPGMLNPELFEKLASCVGTVPAKLLLQLTTAFQDGGLRDRKGSFFYKEYLHRSEVPVLALAGDHDSICPPEAVYETVKVMRKHLVTYRVLGAPNGPHYAHYDLVGSRLAADQIYPTIVNFLSRHDR